MLAFSADQRDAWGSESDIPHPVFNWYVTLSQEIEFARQQVGVRHDRDSIERRRRSETGQGF